jgi:hypothetical protein
MDFDQLKVFIDKSMRMSHIYQPVMLMTLLTKGGKASVRDIATSILIHDESQIEYYEQITKEMVGRVLRKRGLVSKEAKTFELLEFDRPSPPPRSPCRPPAGKAKGSGVVFQTNRVKRVKKRLPTPLFSLNCKSTK